MLNTIDAPGGNIGIAPKSKPQGIGLPVRIVRDLLQPAAQLSGHARMTSETKGSDVFNPAFTAAFDDRHNMVGRPRTDKWLKPWELQPKHIERPVTLRLAFNFPGELRRLKPRLSQQCLKDPHDLIAIGSTKRADPEIALKDLFPKVARIAAKFVFMDAGIRTK